MMGVVQSADAKRYDLSFKNKIIYDFGPIYGKYLRFHPMRFGLMLLMKWNNVVKLDMLNPNYAIGFLEEL
jgi:hypothetical protein